MAIHYADPLDRTFHALGDPTRRAMLSMVAQRGECTAGQLGEPFDIAQPTTSKHLRVLERAGLLTRRVDGRVHLFRLSLQPMLEAEDWIARHRVFWNHSLARLGELIEVLENEEGEDG